VEFAPVAFLTVLVAIAGPIGITLGWWLGKRSERERTAREERKSAYVAFTTAAIQFRNADDDERRQRRNERWEAFSVLTLVAPPAMVEIAAHMVSAGDKLLDPDIDAAGRRAVYADLWQQIDRFTQLARTDLGIDDNDALSALTPVIGDRLTFDHRPVTDQTDAHDERLSGQT
jgi:hypothetical protein